MIGGVFTEAARINWATVPGRDLEMINDEAGNPTQITFKDNGSVVFVQYLTYDNGNVIKVECKSE